LITCSGPAPAAAQGGQQVRQDLLGLGRDVALADDRTRASDRVLAPDVDRAAGTGHDHDVRERRVPDEALRVEMLDTSCCHPRTTQATAVDADSALLR
jgi:hypothetical protein